MRLISGPTEDVSKRSRKLMLEMRLGHHKADSRMHSLRMVTRR